MAIWSSDNILLTAKGREVLSKVQLGNGKITITKVKTSSGRVSESQLHSLTAVSNAKQTMEIVKSTSSENGSNLELRVSNTDLTESYAINQIGVYTSHPDTGEILYMIAQCDEGTADIMPLPSETPATLYYDLYLLHSATQEVEITVDPLGYISNATFDEHLTEFNNLKGSVTTLQETVGIQGEALRNNSEGISKNAEDISKNAEDISKNAEDILKNTEDISKNSESILKNTEDISKNTESISKNAGDITSIRSRVVKVESQTDTNKNNIDMVSGAVISLTDDVENINTYLGLDDDVYGVEVDYENGTYTRIGANVGLTSSDFDNLAPWGGRRRCILANDGEVLAYYGDRAYTETGYLEVEVEKTKLSTEIKTYPIGTPVQVMVEQPKFWYKNIPMKTEKLPNQEGLALLKARYYISTSPKPGFKVFPLFTRGIPLRETDVAYLSAYRGSVYENQELSKASFKCTLERFLWTGSFKIVVALDRYEKKTITKSANDDVISIANKIRALTFDNWKISGQDNVILFECKEYGRKQDPQFYKESDYKSVFEFSQTYPSLGRGGYVKHSCEELSDMSNQSYDFRFMLSSVAEVVPHCGFLDTRDPMTRDRVDKLCHNRNLDPDSKESMFSEGFGWQQRDLSALSCSIWLHLIEYGTLNCQSTIGLGLVDDVSLYYDPYYNGTTSHLGNKSGRAGGEDGKCSVSYRGEEDIWGKQSTWVQGLNFNNKKHKMYFSSSGIYSESVDSNQEGYKPVGFSLPDKSTTVSGYISRIGYSEEFDWGFLPMAMSGSTSEPTHDLAVLNPPSNNEWSAMYSPQTHLSYAGLTSFGLTDISDNSQIFYGGSLLFIPEP